jgi:glycosyltransferase involved in cell wall biosynthesis
MKATIDSLSVFLPSYNEAENIKKTVKNVKENLEKVASKWEILIINDGSKDETGHIADQLAKTDKHIRVIHHHPNRGYGASLKSGLYNSQYPLIAFIDADGQFDFAEITKFIEFQKQTQADLVIGYYNDRKVSFSRKLNSRIWQLIVNLLFGLKVRDIDCGFKLISKKVVDSIPKLESERGAFISSEFLIKAQKQGFKIVEIGVNHYPRLQGDATGAKLNVIIKSFLDLFSLWRKLI